MVPDISVLIPARNEQRNIVGALDSIAQQTGSLSIEILVGVNNSTDNTLEVVKEYAKEFDYNNNPTIVSIKAMNTRIGKANTWNELLFEHAHSNHCVFMDGDIAVHPPSFETLHRRLLENANIAVAAGVKRDSFEQQIPEDQWKQSNVVWITGSLYMCNVQRLVDRMNRASFQTMPPTILSEDGWLTLLLSPDGYEKVYEAVCFHPPCVKFSDYYRKARRARAADLQLKKDYPYLWSKISADGRLESIRGVLDNACKQLSRGRTWRPSSIAKSLRNHLLFYVVLPFANWHGRRDHLSGRATSNKGYWFEFKK